MRSAGGRKESALKLRDLLRSARSMGLGGHRPLPGWMRGRYGVDQLGRLTSTASLVCLLLALVPRLGVLLYAGVALLGVSYWRMFSRNAAARYRENAAYLAYRGRLRRWWGRIKAKAAGHRTHSYFRCVGCGTEMRVPRGKGKVRITCPSCKAQFVRKV